MLAKGTTIVLLTACVKLISTQYIPCSCQRPIRSETIIEASSTPALQLGSSTSSLCKDLSAAIQSIVSKMRPESSRTAFYQVADPELTSSYSSCPACSSVTLSPNTCFRSSVKSNAVEIVNPGSSIQLVTVPGTNSVQLVKPGCSCDLLKNGCNCNLVNSGSSSGQLIMPGANPVQLVKQGCNCDLVKQECSCALVNPGSNSVQLVNLQGHNPVQLVKPGCNCDLVRSGCSCNYGKPSYSYEYVQPVCSCDFTKSGCGCDLSKPCSCNFSKSGCTCELVKSGFAPSTGSSVANSVLSNSGMILPSNLGSINNRYAELLSLVRGPPNTCSV